MARNKCRYGEGAMMFLPHSSRKTIKDILSLMYATAISIQLCFQKLRYTDTYQEFEDNFGPSYAFLE
jgi:hypothetical protein